MSKFETNTWKKWDGGLNVVANDLSITTSYSKIANNVWRAPDGGIAVRWGTRLFADFKAAGCNTIIEHEYFAGYVIVADATGQLFASDVNGSVTPLWSPAIAKILNVPAWSTNLTIVTFTEFAGQLMVHNGIDKPLAVTAQLRCNYLVDLASFSNLFVPVGRYAIAHQQYHVVAGISTAPGSIAISKKAAGGTFAGANAPNDAVTITLDPYVEGDPTIIGLGSIRTQLVVAFSNAIIVLTLGTYDTASPPNHVPTVDDVIQNMGTIGNRTIKFTGDDILFVDINSVQSLKKALVLNRLDPTRASELVDPDMRTAVSKCNKYIDYQVPFAVFNRMDGQYMLFCPNSTQFSSQTDCNGFLYTNTRRDGVKTWSRTSRWNWQSGCRTQLGRVLLSNGAQLYELGNNDDPIYRDFVNKYDTFDDDTMFTDYTGFSPGVVGLPIPFVWELPWQDFGMRDNEKSIKFIKVDAQGDAEFTVSAFQDNLYVDRTFVGEPFTDNTLYTDGTGNALIPPPLRPQLSMTMVGGDALGYGGQGYGGDPYGGGRITSDERQYSWPIRAKIYKLRFEGLTGSKLSFQTITHGFLRGSFRTN